MATSDSTIIVSGLSPVTTEESLHQFFSFCGKIKLIDRHEKTATIVFEKDSAAKTSLMLDGGTLDGTAIQVTGPAAMQSSASGQTPTTPITPGAHDAEEVKQEDKPRSAIAAEYLAHGYILGDQAIAKAIALDQKHGISSKFSSYFTKIQERAMKATSSTTTNQAQTPAPAPAAPTKNLSSLISLPQQYYEKALGSKHGAKVKEFYTTTSKQVLDVHSEARRIAEQKTGHSIFQFPCLKQASQPSTANVASTGPTTAEGKAREMPPDASSGTEATVEKH